MKLKWEHLTWTKNSWPAHSYQARSDGRRYHLYREGSQWCLRMPGGTAYRGTAGELQAIADDFEKEIRS